MTASASARSDVGRVRLSNQDSGYAGTHLFVVADGMGGHAGGDVASGIAVRDLAELDRAFDSLAEARTAVVDALLRVNNALCRLVEQQPELAGLGTTVSLVLRVNERFLIGHIGDSRVYRLSEDTFEQLTRDHTFVQQLIDSGRISEAEAKDHPRRSVLMRVLGDVDAEPTIDCADIPAVTDEWLLLCSDGLTCVLDDDEIARTLRASDEPAGATSHLIDAALRSGAPDNVTVIALKVNEPTGNLRPVYVGSAATRRRLPVVDGTAPARPSRQRARTVPVSTSELPIPPAAGLGADVLTPEEETRRARLRRRVTALIAVGVVVGLVILASVLGYRWTQSRYFIGESDGYVVVFQGVPANIAGISLSHVIHSSNVTLRRLPPYERSQVSQTISFGSESEALTALNRLTGVK